MSNPNFPEVDPNWRIPDPLWEHIQPLLPPQKPRPRGGRPRASDRGCMDGIYYVLRTGCQWKALPRCFGPASTVHDRFQEWRRLRVFQELWRAGLLEYDQRVGLDWEWQAMDGAMTKAPLGGKGNRSQSYRPG
jgi:putative transposase